MMMTKVQEKGNEEDDHEHYRMPSSCFFSPKFSPKSTAPVAVCMNERGGSGSGGREKETQTQTKTQGQGQTQGQILTQTQT